MMREEYAAIVAVQIDVARLASLLTIVADGIDGVPAAETTVDAIELCAGLAKSLSRRIDDVPGFLAMQMAQA